MFNRLVKSLIYRTTGCDIVKRRPLQPSPFIGDYPSFESAAADCAGYDDPGIAYSVFLRRQESIKNAISHIDERFISPLAAIAHALQRINKKSVSVLDFGGANGALADIAKHYFPATEFEWTVVETPSMVNACKSVSDIRWLTEIPEERFDIVTLCGVLQCVPEPYKIIELAALASAWIVIQRIPLGERDIITKMIAPSHIHQGSYPFVFFSEEKFVCSIRKIGNIRMRWTVEIEKNSLPFGVPFGFLIETSPAISDSQQHSG